MPISFFYPGNDWNTEYCSEGIGGENQTISGDQTILPNQTKSPVEEYWE